MYVPPPNNQCRSLYTTIQKPLATEHSTTTNVLELSAPTLFTKKTKVIKLVLLSLNGQTCWKKTMSEMILDYCNGLYASACPSIVSLPGLKIKSMTAANEMT